MAALRTPLFLLALLAGAAVAAAQYTEVEPGDAKTSAIFQKAGPKTFARTLPGSQCQVCKPGGNCFPDALGAGTNSITCTGPCDSCPSGCAFGEPFPFEFNNQVIYLTPCGCPDAAGCGDPHFIGAHGVDFDFHGRAEHEYAIISDQDFALNAHMIGQDWTSTGFTGTWMSRLGFMYNLQGETHKVAFALGETEDHSTTTNVVTVTVDGHVVDLSGSAFSQEGSGLTLSVEDGVFSIAIEGHIAARVTVDDHEFPNGYHLDFAVDSLHATPSAHGVLGQTFQLARAESLKAFAANSTAGSTKAYTDSDIVEGAEDDYEVSGLFEHDFKFNRFVAPGGALVMAGRKLLASTAVRTQVPFTINMSGSSLRIRF